MPRLESWFEIEVNGEQSLAGYVYDDERVTPQGEYSNGHRLVTSKIQTIDRDKKTAQTRNTLYQLGEELPTSNPVSFKDLDEVLPRIAQD